MKDPKKIIEERYNSGLVYTGITLDGEEITDGYPILSDAVVELLSCSSFSYETDSIQISKLIEESNTIIETISTLAASNGYLVKTDSNQKHFYYSFIKE